MTSGSSRCKACTRQRSSLRVAYWRWKKRPAEASKFTGNTFLTCSQRRKKLSSLAKESCRQKKRLQRMTEKIRASIRNNGVALTPSLENDIKTIVEKQTNDMEKILPPGSFKQLFWKQQAKALKARNLQGMSWHPVIIMWALNIKLISSAAYHAIRSSGFLVLPSERSLRDYTHFFHNKSGFAKEVNNMLVKEYALLGTSDIDKHVVIVWMK
eukprot:m.26027 g.26027  ORF g.26027 m.26027 type:complete len:212 (+) comp29073_c0_seq1:325-960(+)